MPRYVDKKADQLKITFRVSSIALQNYKYVKKKLQNMSQAEFGLYLITLAQKYESGELIKDVICKVVNQELISTMKQLNNEEIASLNLQKIKTKQEALPTTEKPLKPKQTNIAEDDFEIILDDIEPMESTKEVKEETSEEREFSEEEIAMILKALDKEKQR